MIGDTWYRYIGQSEQDEYMCEARHHLTLIEFRVVSETAKTVLLVRDRDFIGYTEYKTPYILTHRVLKDARKRFAYPTKPLAFNSFRIRQNHRAQRLAYDLQCVQAYQAAIAVVRGLVPSLT